jgi:hypothetical protein
MIGLEHCFKIEPRGVNALWVSPELSPNSVFHFIASASANPPMYAIQVREDNLDRSGP